MAINENSKITCCMARDKSPCASCPIEEKYPGCHDHCQKFKDWKAELDRLNQLARDYRSRPSRHFNQIDAGIYDYYNCSKKYKI